MKCRITGSPYYVIKSSQQFRVNFLLLYFPASAVVKQGCPMSLILSNIFQNDLDDIFTQECDPVGRNDTSLNSVSRADDLCYDHDQNKDYKHV